MILWVEFARNAKNLKFGVTSVKRKQESMGKTANAKNAENWSKEREEKIMPRKKIN